MNSRRRVNSTVGRLPIFAMSQALITQSSAWRPKRTVLIVAGLFSAALGALVVLPNETGFQFRVVRLVSMVCIALLVLAWCYFDSLERRQPFHAWLRIIILLFGVFALFVYLFQSRGFKQGVRSSGMALLSLAGLFALLFASALMSGLIFGVD